MSRLDARANLTTTRYIDGYDEGLRDAVEGRPRKERRPRSVMASFYRQGYADGYDDGLDRKKPATSKRRNG